MSTLQYKVREWDDIKYLYYNIATKYLKYYPQYDADELVNEAWIHTHDKINIEGYKIVSKIHRVMQSYIREQKHIYQLNKQKYEAKNTSLDEMFENLETNDKADILATFEDGYNLVEIKDFINMRLKNLSISEMNLLQLSLLHTQTQIAAIKERTPQAVSLWLLKIYEKMRYNQKEYYQIDYKRKFKHSEESKLRQLKKKGML